MTIDVARFKARQSAYQWRVPCWVVAQLKTAPNSSGGPLSCKQSEKGGVSVYGLQRMPVTLYAEQWERLLGFADTIREFIKDHPGLARKQRS